MKFATANSRSNSKVIYLLLLLIVNAVLVATCPPLNNIRFSGHNSPALVRETIAEQLSKHNYAWMDAISNVANPHKRWPRPRDQSETVIQYCFETPETAMKARDWIEDGWAVWQHVLGNAGPGSKHSLKLVEEKFKRGSSPYCFQTRPTWNSEWKLNKDCLEGMLAIRITAKDEGDPMDSMHAEATLGYIPPSWISEPDRHGIWFSQGTIDGPRELRMAIACHELGHVFGLMHEHQRSDRNHYFHLNFKNLGDYKKKKAEIESRGEHTIEQVCEDANLCYRYDWTGPPNYSIKPYIEHLDDDSVFRWYYSQGPEYDFDSIMHYESNSYGNYEKDCYHDIKGCALVKWRNGPQKTPPSEVTKDNAKRINMSYWPTHEDVSHLKQLYSWRQT